MNRYARAVAVAMVVGVGAGTAGCGRMNATTVVRADGTCTRTIKLAAAKPDEKGGMNIMPKLDDVFVVPSGPAWKVERSVKDADTICTATRTFKVGDTLQPDIVLKGEKSKAQGRSVEGMVSVKQLSPGVIEYRETLKWVGEKPKEFTEANPEIAADVRKALPAGAATDAEVKKLAGALVTELWRAMFGPKDPLLSVVIMHPDLADRLARRRMSATFEQAVADTLGSKLTEAQRKAFVDKLIGQSIARSSASSKSQSSGPGASSDSSSAFVPVLYSVKLPGKVTATNGQIDGDEVYWAFYSMAPAAGDVVLTATCEVGK